MRRLTTSLLALVAACSLTFAGTPAHADIADPDRADDAITWLQSQLIDGTLEQFGGHPDYGLTLDMVLSMRAADVPADDVWPILAAMDGIAETQLEYEGQPTTGMVGKALVAAHVSGYPVQDFHGKDLVAMALGAIDADGRVDGGEQDAENIFSQAFVVIGLIQQGQLPPEAVEFLLSQQCSEGFFRLYYSDGQTCDEADGRFDVDGTAVALMALEAAVEDGHDEAAPALDRGREWLVSQQGDSGAFIGSSVTPSENSNSSGLAVAVLAGHDPDAAAASAHWVASLMYGTGPDGGAVAYREAEHETWEAGQPLTSAQRGGAIRATPQAILAFAPANYAFIDAPPPQRSAPAVRPGLPPTGN